MRTELESGAWIEHMPVQELKGKDIRGYRRAVKLGITENAVDDEGNVDVRALVSDLDLGEMDEHKHDAVFALVIRGWPFKAEDGTPLPVPSIERSSGIVTGAEAIGELPADDLIEIERILQPYADKLTRRPDPKKGTGSGSSGSSRDGTGRGSRKG